MKDSNEDLLTVAQAAALIGVSYGVVTAHAKTGALPATRFGRAYVIKRSDALNFPRRGRGRPRKVVPAQPAN